MSALETAVLAREEERAGGPRSGKPQNLYLSATLLLMVRPAAHGGSCLWLFVLPKRQGQESADIPA